MNTLDTELRQRLAESRDAGLYRVLRRIDGPQAIQVMCNGKPLLNFSSNDYLGFAGHPALHEAAARALRDYGAGSGASRLISGSLKIHHDLEEKLAEFKGTEASLCFTSGFSAALGSVTALVGPGDIIILDKLVHACLIDAARLSGATLRIYAHNQLDDLESVLGWASQKIAGSKNHVLVVSESVFSMDGTLAQLPQLVALKEKYGAWLMIDEAHATGMYGKCRSGLIEELQLTQGVDIQMGTLGKALGSGGGYVAGSRTLIEFLVNRARSFIFSTAPVPAASAAAIAGIELAQSEEGAQACRRVWENAALIRSKLSAHVADQRSVIVPVMVGKEEKAMQIFEKLQAMGFFVPAIRFPTVARGKSRLRLTCSALHTAQDVSHLSENLLPLLH